MLDWRITYKQYIDGCLNIEDYVKDGVVDFNKLLCDLVENNILCIKCEGAVCTLEFFDVDESDMSKSRLIYAVMYNICSLMRFLRNREKPEPENQTRQLRYFYNILCKTYSAYGLVISVNIDDLRVKVRHRDDGVGRVFRGSVYTVDERTALHEILDMIHEIRESSTVEIERVKKFDSDCYGVSSDDNLESLMEAFRGSTKEFYVCVDNSLVFRISSKEGLTGSELCRFDMFCELIHTIGYYLPVLSDGIVDLFKQYWSTDALVTENYCVKYFKGDYGIVRRSK